MGNPLVDNAEIRSAVTAFAAEPGQRRALDVLRSCMSGSLLFDITGSGLAVQDGSFAAGSQLQIRRASGPDGRGAALAFTRNEAIAAQYPPGTRTQSLVTPAVAALEFARDHDEGWLYIDPAGPTCALSRAEIEFALRNPNNAPLKAALAEHARGQAGPADVLAVLRGEGSLLVAVHDDDQRIRLTALPDGSPGLLVFTSAPEVVAANPDDAVAAFRTGEILAMVRDRRYGGVVVNPAGPYLVFTAAELAS